MANYNASSKGEDEVRCFPPPPSNRLPSPPLRFPPPPTDRLPSPPDTDGSGSAWERPKATISGVTNDARRVLDSFLNRSFGGKPGHIYPPDFDSDGEEQTHQQQEESHYVYPQALQTPKHLICPFNTPQHPPKPSISTPPQIESAEPTPNLKKKQFEIPLVIDSASSSSTEDYELVDPNELLNRKKKSFFRRATERLMHSFRRRKEHGGVMLDEGGLESPKDEFGHHVPKAKSSSNIHPSLNKTGSSSGDNNGCGGGGGGVVHSEGEAITIIKTRKSPLPWKQKVKMKEEPVYSENKGRLLDNLIRGIRKGSFRLKRKGSKEHQRSRSADNLMCIRPLSKEHKKLLRRYGGPMASDGAESDTVNSIQEVPRGRVEHVFPSPAPPSPPAAPRTTTGKDSDDYDEIDEMVAGTGVERVVHSETDEIDGMLQQLFNRQPANQPFHLQTDAQKELLYEKIAEQLAVIADYYNVQMMPLSPSKLPPAAEEEEEEEVKDIPLTPSPSLSPRKKAAMVAAAAAAESSASELEGAVRRSSVKQQQQQQRNMQRKKRRWRKELALQQQIAAAQANTPGQGVREMRDSLDPGGGCGGIGGGGDPAAIVEELVRNASYSKFQQLVTQNIGGEDQPPGWQQIARMFRLTQTAVGLAGMGTAVSLHIKEMTIKYFEDKFAGWIVHQGGWESVVEDTNTENDSELD